MKYRCTFSEFDEDLRWDDGNRFLRASREFDSPEALGIFLRDEFPKLHTLVDYDLMVIPDPRKLTIKEMARMGKVGR